MHSWAKGEAPSLRSLLSVSRPPSLLTALVSYKADEMISGWEAVRPCAEYDCTVWGLISVKIMTTFFIRLQ